VYDISPLGERSEYHVADAEGQLVGCPLAAAVVARTESIRSCVAISYSSAAERRGARDEPAVVTAVLMLITSRWTAMRVVAALRVPRSARWLGLSRRTLVSRLHDLDSDHETSAMTTRRFKRGDHVSWNSEAGRVRGRITRVVTSEIQFKGYTVRASKDEPQYEIKSDTTDHIAMHKGSALRKLSR
jgi:hypothetical protein